MGIRLRMIFIFALILGLMAGQVFITLSLVSHLALSFADISQKYLAQIERINEIHKQLVRVVANPGNPEFTELDAMISEYVQNHDGPPEQLVSFQNSYYDFKRNYQSGQKGSIPLDSYLTFTAAADRMLEINTRQVRDTAAASSRVTAQSFYFLSIVVSLVTLIGIVFGWYFAHSFSRGLKALISATENAARGDFSPMRWDSPDEFGRLVKAFNNMMKSLQKNRLEGS